MLLLGILPYNTARPRHPGGEREPDAPAAAGASGAGARVERASELFTIVKLAGAAYLVYLGVQAFRHRRSMAEALAARVTPLG